MESLTKGSSFTTLYPERIETYLQHIWPTVVSTLERLGIVALLDFAGCSMTVKLQEKTCDPAAILNARDVINLLARSVPLSQAIKVMDDPVASDIIPIGVFTNDNETFVKRRQRLLGPKGVTLKTLELLTDCFILVQGVKVSAIGPVKGLKTVRRVVEDCMQNTHPNKQIPRLIVEKYLAENPELANESRHHFLPQYEMRDIQRKKTAKVSKKKKYRPFPLAQQLFKIDLQIESGGYFLGKQDKESKVRNEKNETQAENSKERERGKETCYV